VIVGERPIQDVRARYTIAAPIPAAPVPEDQADTVDLSKNDVKLRNTISPNPEPILAQTTPKMMRASTSDAATRMKLANDATVQIRILIQKGTLSIHQGHTTLMIRVGRMSASRIAPVDTR
jgi:hypothetical protein